MTDEAPRKTLGDYFTLQRGITYKSRLLGMPGPILLGLATIERNGGFRRDSIKTYGGDSPGKLLVKPGELYLSLKDVTQAADLLGAVARLPLGYLPGRLTQDTVKLEPRGEMVPIDYLYWLLRTPQYRSYCRAHATGTTNLGLAREDFLAFPVTAPSTEQTNIVSVLEVLEEKIELNRRMNETLEAMARALFQSWFVDFDPIHRNIQRAQGHTPSNPKRAEYDKVSLEASAEWDALFPDAFEDSELGMIPKGWCAGPLDSVVVLQRGFDLPTSQRTSGPYPILAASGPSGGHSESKVKGPGVTTGRSGVLGNVFYVHEDFWPLNTSLWVKEFRNSTPTYAYHMLRRIDLGLFNAGSAVPTLNRNHVHTLPTLMPPMNVIRHFEEFVVQTLKRQKLNEGDCRTLVALRDALLPKLISGELRVKDAEQFVEGTV